MRGFLVFLAILVFAEALAAQDITIRGLNRTRAFGWVFVDNGWLRNTDLIEAKFVVKSGMSGKLPIRWGFFDADKKLLGKFTGIPRMEAKTDVYQVLPESLLPNHTYSICFPIPPSLASGANRWRTFALELGSPPSSAAAIYPTSGEPDDFPLDAKKSRAELAASEIKPSIKRISQYRNGMSAWVDDAWVRGLNTLKVTVQLDSGAEDGDFYVRVYFFDADKKRIFDWKGPPQVAVKAGGTFASLPATWKNAETYDLHFPIPAVHDRGAHQWRTAIVLFGNKKTVVVQSYPAIGKTGDFDFPEKERAVAP